MNKVTLSAALAALVLIVSAGAALARGGVTIDCADDPRARCAGTDAGDGLFGENDRDRIDGARDIISARAGNDSAEGRAAPDVIRGNAGGDFLSGGTGGDRLFGGEDDDPVIDGGAGSDRIAGGPGSDGGDSQEGGLTGGTGDNTVGGGVGNDEIDGNGSDAGDTETLRGGADDDVIVAQDGQDDTIDCGPGDDRAVGDTFDVISNCETVIRVPTGR